MRVILYFSYPPLPKRCKGWLINTFRHDRLHCTSCMAAPSLQHCFADYTFELNFFKLLSITGVTVQPCVWVSYWMSYLKNYQTQVHLKQASAYKLPTGSPHTVYVLQSLGLWNAKNYSQFCKSSCGFAARCKLAIHPSRLSCMVWCTAV